MMCEKGETKLLWLSAAAGSAYLAWAGYYIVENGGTVWPGMSAFVMAPHLFCAVFAIVRTIAGIIAGQDRAVMQGAISYGAAAVLFPPFHMFLFVPALLIAGWYLSRQSQLAV